MENLKVLWPKDDSSEITYQERFHSINNKYRLDINESANGVVCVTENTNDGESYHLKHEEYFSDNTLFAKIDYDKEKISHVTIYDKNTHGPAFIGEIGKFFEELEWPVEFTHSDEVLNYPGHKEVIDSFMISSIERSDLGKFMPESKEELVTLVRNDSIRLGDIDVSNITDMSFVFMNANRSDYTGIETWDVSHVKDMFAMFENSNFNHPIGNWDVSNVDSMGRMFMDTPFNQTLEGWDLSDSIKCDKMFLGSNFRPDSYDMDLMNIKDASALGLTVVSKSFKDALQELIKEHKAAGKSLPEIGKELKEAYNEAMLDLGKAHVAGKGK